MKDISLKSERLKLVKLNLSFLSDTYVKWLNDEHVNKYLESGGDYTLEKLEEFLKNQEEKEIYFWAIILKSNSKHIGNIKIDPIKNNIGEYGILLGDKEEWGKGFAKEASKTIIDYCFNVLNLKEIRLGVKTDNISAIKLYQKLGFLEYEKISDRNLIRMKFEGYEK